MMSNKLLPDLSTIEICQLKYLAEKMSKELVLILFLWGFRIGVCHFVPFTQVIGEIENVALPSQFNKTEGSSYLVPFKYHSAWARSFLFKAKMDEICRAVQD